VFCAAMDGWVVAWGWDSAGSDLCIRLRAGSAMARGMNVIPPAWKDG